MSLFAAGVALLALLFASYSRRSTLLALASKAMSMAALIGCLFLATIQDRNQVQTRLAWIASKLPLVLDRQIVDDLAAAIERMPASSPTTNEESPSPKPEAMQAASTTSWFGSKPGSKPTSDFPVTWRLGDQPVSSGGAPGFSISGTNVSNQTLEGIHAVLKPDASQRELALALAVEGHKYEAGTVIPAGARFSFVSETANDDGSKQLGGAILTFRYVQAGQRKTSILYLSPSMIARPANPR